MNLLKTFFGIGGMTTISRILGFIRDTVIARIFGAGLESDAFFVAFKILAITVSLIKPRILDIVVIPPIPKNVFNKFIVGYIIRLKF